MSYQACDIDKLRDLVRRQYYAKNRSYHDGWGFRGAGFSAEEVERQLNTYMGQGTTVAALTKCVEEIEAEATGRVTKERERYERRTEKQRALRVVNIAQEIGRGADPRKLSLYGESPYPDSHKIVSARFVEECEKVIKWIRDPWEDA